MSDVSNTAPVANKTRKRRSPEKIADREAKKAQKREAEKVASAQKKARRWERKGRNSKGQKAYDFNSNTENGSFLEFDSDTVTNSRRVKGIRKEEIFRDVDTGDAIRSRSWLGGFKRKIEYTEERFNQETGQREDVRTGKEKQNFLASKNVAYHENGAKTIERGTRNGLFSITYTNNPDGSRSFNGFKLGPFKINQSKGENGTKSFAISIGKSLSYSTLTEANGNTTRNYNINRIYSNSKTVNSEGELVRSEKTYFGTRTKTIENTAEGSIKYTTKGRSVDEMTRDGLDENQIKEAINKDIDSGKVYRLKRTNERGEVTRDYNRQTYKGKDSDYIAGDKVTNDVLKKSSLWGWNKQNSQKLSREQIAARNDRKAELEFESRMSSLPGTFPSKPNPADQRFKLELKVAEFEAAAGAKDTDAKDDDAKSVASFATALTSSAKSTKSGKGSIALSAKTSQSDASYSSTATTANSQTALQAKLEEHSRRRDSRGGISL